MKKSLKIYLLSWLGVVVLFVLLIVANGFNLFAPHHRVAIDSTNIVKITGLDLPEVLSVNSWNNLDRYTSRWDCFEHNSQFVDKLSEDCIAQLENLCQTDTVHWHKDIYEGSYVYLDDAWNRGDIYCISCRISERGSYVEYYVDESEGEEYSVLIFMVILLLVSLLIVWGIVWLIVVIVRRITRRNE